MKAFYHTIILGVVALFWMQIAPAQQILISDLQDVNLGEVQPTLGDIQSTMSFCVALSDPGTYRLTAFGDGLGGAFDVRSGPYDLPYEVGFTDKKKSGAFRPILSGVPQGGLKVRQNNNGICRRNNATLEVTFNAADLLSAPGGFYQGTLTLMVSPE